MIDLYPWIEMVKSWHWVQHPNEYQQALVTMLIFFTFWFYFFLLKALIIKITRICGCPNPKLYNYLSLIPWRPLMRIKMELSRWIEHVFKISKHSSSGFNSVLSTLTITYKNPSKEILLGLPWLWGGRSYQPIGQAIKTHMLCIGQSGSGKSVWIKTILGLWKGSIVSIDPKGEFARDIYSCKTSHQIVNLKPLEPESSEKLNPFDFLHECYKQGGESIAIQAATRIALVFIETPPDSKQPFFTDTSRDYLKSLILFVYAYYPKELHNLGTVRDLITRGLQVFNEDGSEETSREEAFATLHKLMMECGVFSQAISGGVSPFISAGQETLGSLSSTLQQGTQVLDIPSVRHMLSATTRPLSELKSCNDYILNFVAPITAIRGELKSIVRLVTNLVMYTFENDTIPKNRQTLFIGEELNAQGYNSCIEMFLPIARSMGISFIGAIQDLPSLKAHYPHTYLSFIGNSDATIWLQTSHPDNLSLLSRLLGKTTRVEKDKRTGKKQRVKVDVAEPDQLARYLDSDTGNMIVTRAGKRALRLKLDPHHKALSVSAHDADPDHKEPMLKRFARYLLSLKSKKSVCA